MKLNRRLVLAALSCFAIVGFLQLAEAVMIASARFEVDLTDPKKAKELVSWSEPEQIGITGEGLGWDGEPAASRDGWILTEPKALGLSWRPTYGASVRVAIHPLPEEFTLANGQKSTGDNGSVFVRCSPDLKHWSTWQILQRAEPQNDGEKKNPGRLYSGNIQVAQVDRKRYNDLVMEYGRLDVPWKSDEEAAVKWILEQEPDFFEKQIPFIGYLQIRWEGSFLGGQRIRSFKADIGYSMSGLHTPPRDENDPRYQKQGPWRFKADEEE